MTIPVLQTKLHIPFLRPNLVPRRRLIELLNDGVEKRLILISAPAGYGKTTLIVEWLREVGLPVAWVSLDEGDNDPARFFNYLVSALQTILPEAGTTTLTMLQSPQRPALEMLLSLLINDLVRMPNPFILVLDDYHVLQAQPVHEAVTFLLDHLPEKMHLVIGTRADPALPVARLRGRGQLTELRLSDLRFNTEEAVEFINQTIGFSLDAKDLDSLVTRAEGWAAGLQMAALALQAQVSIQGKEALPGFIRSFTGSNRYILDYLMEEVLQRQPIYIQEFLLHTCILERLSGPLCDALLESSSSSTHIPASSILEHLDRSNLFIVPLDDQRQWYRYHHLFSDLLNQRLFQSRPEIVPVLHRRASNWFEHNGWINEAIEHALSARDHERAATLIAQAAEPTLMRSEVATYMHWVEQIPMTILQSQPRLIVIQAWGLLFSGYSQEKIEVILESLGDQAESPLTAPIRGYIALFQGKITLSIELFRLALDRLPESEHFLRGLSAMCLANAYLSEYEVITGIQTLEEVAKESQRTGNVMVAVLVFSSLADLGRKLGQLHKAQAYYQQAVDLATDAQGRHLPVASRPLVGLGDLRREWNDLETASQYLKKSIALSQYWGRASLILALFPLIRVRMSQRAWAEAQQCVAQARKVAVEFTITSMDDYLVEMYQAWLWIAQGNLAEASQWVKKYLIEESVDNFSESDAEAYNLFHLRKYEQLILVRLYLAQNKPAQALHLLGTLLPKFERIGRMVQVIEIKILRSMALQALGRTDEALAELGIALTLAEPEGYIRLFLDEGNQIQSMLHKLGANYEPRKRIRLPRSQKALARNDGSNKVKVEDQGLRAYIQKLLTAFDAETKTLPSPLTSMREEHLLQPPLYEPLSQREGEVLRFLSGKLSAEQIANELFVSVHTVRSHLKSIYSKLGVHSRLEAVEKAKELKFL